MLNYSENNDREANRIFLEKLNQIDFGPLAYKLMHAEDRPGLSCDQAIDAIKKYKGFLFLYHINNGGSISPSRYIDHVWHTHITDTELYAVQTAYLFGYYLHHFPFFGNRSEEDRSSLFETAARTMQRASFYFGWDDDDWCGTKPPKWPFPPRGYTDLIDVIFPAGANLVSDQVSPDVVSFNAGNFRCTIEHLSNQTTTTYYSIQLPNRKAALERILKLPPWVVICKPVNDILKDIFRVESFEGLADVAQSLVAQRLSPESFSADQVRLDIKQGI